MTNSTTSAVPESPSLAAAIQQFFAEMESWVRRVVQANPNGISSGSHDGGTFMIPWASYARTTGDPRPLPFMKMYRDRTRARFVQNDSWSHGYWKKQEAHHGTEHFELFLGSLVGLDKTDRETVRQLEDAAHHIGNWSDGAPDWYDWGRGVFRSLYLGTEFVGEPSLNFPEHVRMISIALIAHDATGEERYLDFAIHYGERWARAILENTGLPIGIDSEGPVYRRKEGDEDYDSFAGEAPDDLGALLARAENLVASAVPEAMLRLWEKTNNAIYRDAAARITEVAAEEIANPIAWQAQAAVRRFRNRTGSEQFDELLEKVPPEQLRDARELTMVIDPAERVGTGPLGMRSDKPDWLDENGDAAPSPLLWALTGIIKEDRELLRRAVDLGRAYFCIAQLVFGDVTEHGCGSRSLSAVARGHGRLNGAGVVTEVLEPAVEFSESF